MRKRDMVRRATREDLPVLEEISRRARAYMGATGNPTQWTEGYPEAFLAEDIEAERLYVLCGGDGAVHGFFVFLLGEEPSYRVIDGAWQNGRPYGTIHRLAGDGTVRGLFEQCLEFCKTICPNIRADTHKNNATMRHLLEKNGFVYCGVVNLDKLEGDTLRVAYQLAPRS